MILAWLQSGDLQTLQLQMITRNWHFPAGLMAMMYSKQLTNGTLAAQYRCWAKGQIRFVQFPFSNPPLPSFTNAKMGCKCFGRPPQMSAAKNLSCVHVCPWCRVISSFLIMSQQHLILWQMLFKLHFAKARISVHSSCRVWLLLDGFLSDCFLLLPALPAQHLINSQMMSHGLPRKHLLLVASDCAIANGWHLKMHQQLSVHGAVCSAA